MESQLIQPSAVLFGKEEIMNDLKKIPNREIMLKIALHLNKTGFDMIEYFAIEAEILFRMEFHPCTECCFCDVFVQCKNRKSLMFLFYTDETTSCELWEGKPKDK